MELSDVTSRIGDFTTESIAIVDGAPAEDEEFPRILWVNAAYTALTGYSADEVVGQSPAILHGPDTEAGELARISAALAEGRPVTARLTRYTKSGQPFESELLIRPICDTTGAPRFWVGIERDVSEWVEREENLRARMQAHRATEQVLKQEKAELAAIAAVTQNAEVLISITDTAFHILWANDAYLARVGYPLAAIVGLHPCALLSKKSTAYTSRETAIQAVLKGKLKDNEVYNVDSAGNEFYTNVRITTLQDENGRVDRFVIVERDVTAERAQRLELEHTREEIAWAALHDPLTGLPNRRGFSDFVEPMVEETAARGQRLAILHIDLDFFKQINDTLGHAAGDAVLLSVGARLQALIGPDSFAARIGGDEFVIAHRFGGDEAEIGDLAAAIVKQLSRPVKVDGSECRIGASVGFSICGGAPCDPSDLMIQADIALYRAKENGRNCVEGFDQDLARETRHRKQMADELAVALEEGQFEVFYQPQIDAETGTLAGMEALVRWQHPRLGLTGPDAFLPIARDLGIEARIDRGVMMTALADLARMRAAGVPVPRVSVNVSSRRLKRQDLVEEVAQLDFRPGDLAFELVESTFLDDKDTEVLSTIERLRNLGIEIEIDDFGTGHASIVGLSRVRPHRLKVDKSLALPAIEDEESQRLFELIVEIGATLGIGIVVEGVETEEHVALARGLGCTVLQGFYYAPALAAGEFIARFGAVGAA